MHLEAEMWHKTALWKFGDEDLESAIIGIAYPRKQKKPDEETGDKINLIVELRKLIMGKFGDDKNAFYEWSQTIHDEVRQAHLIGTMLILKFRKFISEHDNHICRLISG